LKVSIITAVLNSGKTVADCIASVQNQNSNQEHIIIDGQSSDGSIEIIKQHIGKSTVFLSEQDKGFYDAVNKGIQMASGDVIGILNADDVYAHDRVLKKVSECLSDESVESCYGDLVYVDSADNKQIQRYWQSGHYHRKRFFHGWMPPHPTFFVRREVYERYGPYRLDRGSASDYEFMLRVLLKHKISSRYIPEVLVKMRVGGQSNASIKNRLEAHRMDRKAWDVNSLKPYPWTLPMKPLRKIGQWIKPHFVNGSELGFESPELDSE